jgi:uncharacterized protein (TIGR00730 family)
MSIENSKDKRAERIINEYKIPNQKFIDEKVENMIVFFGSARAPSTGEAETLKKSNPNNPKLKLTKYSEDAEMLAFMLSEWNQQTFGYHKYSICTGGGPGIMRAANKGAYDGGGKSIGLSIELPFEEETNPYLSENLDFNFHYFFMRKFWFAYRAEALVIMPGGFGTMDELFEMLTLIQCQKIKKTFPIVMFGKEFWNKFLNMEALLDYGVINKEDLDNIFYTDEVDEAYKYITFKLEKLNNK